MRARLTDWLALADERLRPDGIPPLLHARQRRPGRARATCSTRRRGASHAEGRVVTLDDDHEMISWGYSNITPWHSHREQTEEELGGVAPRRWRRSSRDPTRAVFNLHVPPFGSGLDDAPVLDADLTVQQSVGQVKFAPGRQHRGP